jgi:hypothetical protein
VAIFNRASSEAYITGDYTPNGLSLAQTTERPADHGTTRARACLPHQSTKRAAGRQGKKTAQGKTPAKLLVAMTGKASAAKTATGAEPVLAYIQRRERRALKVHWWRCRGIAWPGRARTAPSGSCARRCSISRRTLLARARSIGICACSSVCCNLPSWSRRMPGIFVILGRRWKLYLSLSASNANLWEMAADYAFV